MSQSLFFRPWGYFVVLEEKPGYKIKRLSVLPGKALSLQRHHKRSEHWTVVEGVAHVKQGNRIKIACKDQSVYIPKMGMHKLINPGPKSLEVIEVQVGAYLGEDDIERFDSSRNGTETVKIRSK